MSRKRLTVKVSEVKDLINDMLLNSMADNKQGREALGVALEKLLMETRNYKGFAYLNRLDMLKSTNGTTVGVNLTEDNQFEQNPFKRFNDVDHSRVFYF